MVKLRILSGSVAATSSMSMPPAREAMTAMRPCGRSTSMARYSSLAMLEARWTSTQSTGCPSGPDCLVTRRLPSRSRTTASTLSSPSQNLTPPALPRPPACTWALTTHGPWNSEAWRMASLMECAGRPAGTGIPYSSNSVLAWYSCRFIASGFLAADPVAACGSSAAPLRCSERAETMAARSGHRRRRWSIPFRPQGGDYSQIRSPRKPDHRSGRSQWAVGLVGAPPCGRPVTKKARSPGARPRGARPFALDRS